MTFDNGKHFSSMTPVDTTWSFSNYTQATLPISELDGYHAELHTCGVHTDSVAPVVLPLT